MNNKTKIVLATRTKEEGLLDCKRLLDERFNTCSSIKKIHFVCNIGPTAFNSVISEMSEEKVKKEGEFHLLTYSKEVDLQCSDIEEMINEIEKNKNRLIVVGYRLRDNVTSPEELKEFANGSYEKDDVGIAYKVPWSTCALWNKKFVYGEGIEKLRFDEICEKNKNQLGKLIVKINGNPEFTDYQGMEDGLAIAELVTNNVNLKYKLIKRPLSWKIQKDKVKDHKIKLARKNIVLSTFMNIKGYSVESLMKAAI